MMQVLTLMEMAEHYQDNIIYQDNLLIIIKRYQDITFPLSHSPNKLCIYTRYLAMT